MIFYTGFICPHDNCYHKLEAPRAVTPDTTMEKGDLFVCPNCGEVSKLEATSLEKLTDDEWATMPEEAMKDLEFAKRNILARYEQNKKQQ